jgi:hypothetical protein
VIFRVRVAGGREQDRPVGTAEHTHRVSDLLGRESECCCGNGSGLLRRQSEWCRKDKTETSNNIVHLQCEEKGDPGWQSKEMSLKAQDTSNWVTNKGDTS